MPGPYRVNLPKGAKHLDFCFDGNVYRGVDGDTVASALLANRVRIVSRSFKFHRPRGIYSAGFEEPNALVQLNFGAHAVPSARAPLVPLTPDLHVFSQSGWPRVSHDLLRAIDFVHPLFAAGFYNKAFIWPKWKTYEPIIRKLAGLGRVPAGPDPDRYHTHHAHCDMLVIGGGAAGVDAAIRAGSTGQQVMLVELEDAFGADTSALRRLTNVRLFLRTTAVASYDHGLFALAESVAHDRMGGSPRERLWLVRAGKVVLATGAIEQPLIFSNNDRPGIMLAGAALKYLRRHGIAPGRQVVVATNNDSACAVATELHQAGVKVLAVLDSRRSPPPQCIDQIQALNIPLHIRSLPVDSAGFGGLREVTVGRLGTDQTIGQTEKIACDALLVSGGWSPALQLFAQSGGQLAFSESTQTFQPAAPHPSIELVGAAGDFAPKILGPRVSPVGKTSRQWVDLRHDVTVADIELAVRENYSSVEHIKRYTTLGMSVDQGKIGQAPAAEV